jgi:hypothetical protein
MVVGPPKKRGSHAVPYVPKIRSAHIIPPGYHYYLLWFNQLICDDCAGLQYLVERALHTKAMSLVDLGDVIAAL